MMRRLVVLPRRATQGLYRGRLPSAAVNSMFTQLGDCRMRTGICHLCRSPTELCRSHALPKSLFKELTRNFGGKAIAITDDATTLIQYSSDTWDRHLLCAACEDKLNKSYDEYGMAVLRGRLASLRRGETGMTFQSIDRQRLRMFFLSILWRISVSSHHSYSNIDLPSHWQAELHEALLKGKRVASSRFHVAIYRLRDTTPSQGFSEEDLESIVMAPFARGYNCFISVCYLFHGFFVETFLPRLPKQEVGKPGVLTGTGEVFMTPYLEVLDVPEVMILFAQGLRKHETGLSRIS
jgi:hypothetical protein